MRTPESIAQEFEVDVRLVALFRAHVPTPQSGCWEWAGSRRVDGYGRIGFQRQEYLAHRLAWIIHHGPIPPGLEILHQCDNPPCVRPDHLLVGTHAANIRDMWKKGRGTGGHVRGEQVGTHKLTTSDVAKIKLLRAAGKSQRAVATMFGVSRRTIQFIDHGVWWKHVA